MQKVSNLREKLRRKLSIHDKNPNFDEHEEVDEETEQRLAKELAEAEKDGYPMGKPGSFLNRLIAHGNKKTDDELQAESRAAGSTATKK